MEENKDTLPQGASSETPPTQQTQVETNSDASATDGKTTVTEEKVYAGKYKSPEDLETAYKSLESKLGQKQFTEQLGDKIIQATGRSQDDLVKAGYTPEQIVEALIQYQQTGVQQPPQGLDSIQSKVDNTKLSELEWELKRRDFFDSNEDMKEHKDLIEKFHKLDPSKPIDKIVKEDVMPVLDSVAKVTETKQSAKEKAALNITDAALPPVDPSKTALEQYQKSGHIDDATQFVAARLFGGKKDND